jgi:hypothetical protein
MNRHISTLEIINFFFFISENERQLGFVLVIDRRSDRWMSVKSIMSYIEVKYNFINHI